MAYDEGLATRIQNVLASRPDWPEEDVRRARVSGARQHGLRRARRRPERAHRRRGGRCRPGRAGRPAVRSHGRPMKGWLLVDPDGHAEDEDLRRWVERGLAYASSLPSKVTTPASAV